MAVQNSPNKNQSKNLFEKKATGGIKSNANIKSIIHNNLLKSNSNWSLYDSESNHYSSIDSKTNSRRNSNNVASAASICHENYEKKFCREWTSNKKLYFTIQNVFLTINFILTISMFGLSIWINLDPRFIFITNLGNKILYTSINRILPMIPMICIITNSFSFFLDICQLFIYLYIRKFLNSHTEIEIKKILKIQKTMLKLNSSAYEEVKLMGLQKRLRERMRFVVSNFRPLVLMVITLYFTLILAPQFFMGKFQFSFQLINEKLSFLFKGLFLHFKSQRLLNFELQQTILKIEKVHEKQQFDYLNNQDPIIMVFRSVKVNSIEEKLINEMKERFNCCVNRESSFDFWYRMGDLTRTKNCDFHNSCLKEFTWYYMYFSVVVILFAASLRFLIQLVLSCSFQFLLVEKLIRNLYEFNHRKFLSKLKKTFDGYNV